MKLLFLDDERIPSQVTWVYDPKKYYQLEWIIVRNYQHFIEYIQINGLPDLISFDNDLQEEKEGVDCANWLMNYCIDNKLELMDFLVHSMNPSAGFNIQEKLSWFRKNYHRFL